jgi:hypothetical protein
MVDAKDLKSFGLIACAGSNPALGTILRSCWSFVWQTIFFEEIGIKTKKRL